MNLHEMLLKQLDAGFEHWRVANQWAPRPKEGWVRTIRKALHMTIAQLAKRIGVSSSRIVAIEMAEPEGGITLRTLSEVANAMECEFVYALVPKKSLKILLKERAETVAKSRIQHVSHSMLLEDQAVSKEFEREQFNDLVQLLSSKPRLLNSLWNELGTEISKTKLKDRKSADRKNEKRKPTI